MKSFTFEEQPSSAEAYARAMRIDAQLRSFYDTVFNAELYAVIIGDTYESVLNDFQYFIRYIENNPGLSTQDKAIYIALTTQAIFLMGYLARRPDNKDNE